MLRSTWAEVPTGENDTARWRRRRIPTLTSGARRADDAVLTFADLAAVGTRPETPLEQFENEVGCKPADALEDRSPSPSSASMDLTSSQLPACVPRPGTWLVPLQAAQTS